MIDRFLKTYYFATPLWWLLDSQCGINIRAAGFEGAPHLKQIYYTVCMACALVIWFKPRYTPFVVMSESSVNILALILGVITPILKFAENVGGDASVQTPLTTSYIVNFCIAGSVAILGFYRSQNQITRFGRP